MESKHREIIAREFRNCVTNTIQRLENEETYRPFHAALLSEDALFWSRFERSFSTSFGQRVIEEISKVVAVAGGASESSRQKETIVKIDSAYVAAIDAHIAAIRDGRGIHNWDDSLSSILEATPTGNLLESRIISDLWWNKDGKDHYMSIKTVKPNIDQTAVAKKDLLTLKVNNTSCTAYFGLYYNPYGEDKTSYAHNPPMRVFDFRHDSVVLIGKEYWDTLGGEGCYEEVLEIANSVGNETREMMEHLRP